MSVSPDATLAEEERLAEAVYDRLVRPTLRPEDDGKYVAVAFELEDFEVDADDYAATHRLLARRPGARVWLSGPGGKLPTGSAARRGIGREHHGRGQRTAGGGGAPAFTRPGGESG